MKLAADENPCMTSNIAQEGVLAEPLLCVCQRWKRLSDTGTDPELARSIATAEPLQALASAFR